MLLISLADPQELQKLRRLIDSDPKLFTTDVLLRLMLTYRDIQVRKIAHATLIYSPCFYWHCSNLLLMYNQALYFVLHGYV